MARALPVWAIAALSGLLAAPAALAADWTVTITAHEIGALTNSDNWGEQDIYWEVRLAPPPGAGAPARCNTDDQRIDDLNRIRPDWTCTVQVSGAADPAVEIMVTAFDQDVTSGDDEFDLNPDHGQLGVPMTFRPKTSELVMSGYPAWAAPRCAMGRIRLSGLNGGGDEPAELVFSLSASPVNAVDGDSDGDGLPDAWERCGVDHDGDAVAELDLKAMGGNPFRKDLFVEIDWMVDQGGVAPHSHAPWLPAMVNAWHEMNLAEVTNPPGPDGAPTASGIALHLDVGTLYASYGTDTDGAGGPDRLDLNGDTVNDLPVGPSGNLDMDQDGIPDIGALGLLGGPPGAGGNQLPEDASLDPPSTVTGMPTSADIFAPGSDVANIRSNNFAPARDRVFHYAIFGHAYPQVVGGPANSSGLADESCGRPVCSDFVVTLGGFGRQTVDADLNNEPDPGGAPLLGPLGLQVDGTVNEHVGTFLHELGHNLTLRHGGGDGHNFKPNFLSIENYHWQMEGLSFDADGDLLGDRLGVNLNADSITDVRRFTYGRPPALDPLDENTLDETAPVAPGSPMLTRHACPPVAGMPPFLPLVPAGAATDWNCDGLTSATPVTVDVNGSGTFEVLPGFDDSAQLGNGGLNLSAGIGREQERQLRASTQRITEPAGREVPQRRCGAEGRLDFEDLPRGTEVTTQYAPDVTFLADERRRPFAIGPGDRNDVPTSSPGQSLLNDARGEPAPLSFTFARSQRSVTLRFGQAGLASGPQEGIRAVFQAFDRDDLPMGRIVKPLPPAALGITQELTALAILPDQLIRRVELSYEFSRNRRPDVPGTLLDEPVQIDDLTFCAELEDGAVTPALPEPPRFGELPVHLAVRSELLFELPGPDNGEPGKTVETPNPFSGLNILVDGAAATTGFDLTRNEGTTVELEAPVSSGSGRFLYWRHSSGARFGTGINAIPLTLLRDGTITAVYEGRRREG